MKPGSDTIEVLGFPTTTLNRTDILRQVDSWIQKRDKCNHLMALNPIKVCRAQKEEQLRQYIHEADLVYPDAFGIAWAMRKISGHEFSPIPGCELMLDLTHRSAEAGYGIYLLGASKSVLEQARKELLRVEPKLRIYGYHSGYFESPDEERATLHDIVSSKPDLVFVGMGAVVQERWITRIVEHCHERHTVIPVLMGVGGSFDAITGVVRRPPRWMLDSHLEWFFRLLQQPFRAPRMLALPRFALQVMMSLHRTAHN